MIIENKKYFIDQINSSKANRMTALYHYSGVGFKKARINLGIFKKETKLMVGVLQFGCSFQDKIRLDRYVKEPIKKEEYLELNRFSMADSEEKNSESQAISLGIKWIKKNMPQIKLLVSYAGRKEGNYGYIYQATNWEYLGYFISSGFWLLDGEERHLTTLWYRYKHHGNQNLGFIDGICDMYQDVRKTWTKQFIYIQRLDKHLTPATPILEYPKPANEYPIKTREVIYKQNDEVFNAYKEKPREWVEYYYEKDEPLFSNPVMLKRGLKEKQLPMKIASYDLSGNLEAIFDTANDAAEKYQVLAGGVRDSARTKKSYKQNYFRKIENENDIPEKIEVSIVCLVDEIPFNSLAEVGRYLGVTRQAVCNAKRRNQNHIGKKSVIWADEGELD